jgi:hypothetical protein
MYLGSTLFESRLDSRISWLTIFVEFLSLSKRMQKVRWDRPLPLALKSSCDHQDHNFSHVQIKSLLQLIKANMSLCLSTEALCHAGEGGSGCTERCFHDLDTSWRRVLRFTSLPHYPGERVPIPIGEGIGWSESRSRRCGEVNIIDSLGTWTPTPLLSSS